VIDETDSEPLTATPSLPRGLVRFLGCTGLACLLTARDLTQASETRLHLAGLVTPVVACELKFVTSALLLAASNRHPPPSAGVTSATHLHNRMVMGKAGSEEGSSVGASGGDPGEPSTSN